MSADLVGICVFTVFWIPNIICLSTEERNLFSSKATVEANSGSRGSVSVSVSGSNLAISSNGIPDHATGTFPGRGNPNKIQSQRYSFSIPNNPAKAARDSCVGMGPVAVSINGVPMFNPYTLEQKDAVEYEVFDSCNGHPAPNGAYHYHQDPKCLYTPAPNKEVFIGVAMDGFPIYVSLDQSGKHKYKSADLDRCHGTTVGGNYRYYVTADFPYIIGCYRGSLQWRSRGVCSFALADDYVGKDTEPHAGQSGIANSVVLIGTLVASYTQLI